MQVCIHCLLAGNLLLCSSLSHSGLGLAHLCEFIEDCEHVDLATRILHLLGKEGPRTQQPFKYIRFIYNRVLLESPPVRAGGHGWQILILKWHFCQLTSIWHLVNCNFIIMQEPCASWASKCVFVGFIVDYMVVGGVTSLLCLRFGVTIHRLISPDCCCCPKKSFGLQCEGESFEKCLFVLSIDNFLTAVQSSGEGMFLSMAFNWFTKTCQP